MKAHPPKFYHRLFRWFCQDDFFEELEGDLEEKFYLNLESKGARYAKSVYRKEVMLMIRPSVLKKPAFINTLINLSLFRIHLKLTFRNIARNKVYSAVNIFGLAAALSLCLFFVNLIYTGYSMDAQHSHLDRFYRVYHTQKSEYGINQFATASYALSEKLKHDFPQIELSTTVFDYMNVSIRRDGNDISVEGIYVDSTFFDLFEFEMVTGDPKSIFSDINSIVLTEEAAVKLFGDDKPLGEILGKESIVKAIIKSPRSVSHLDFEAIGNINGHLAKIDPNNPQAQRQLDWGYNYSYFHYIRLKEKTDPGSLETLFAQLANEVNAAHFNEANEPIAFKLQAVSDINFGKELIGDTAHVFPGFVRNTFLVLTGLIILIASFNYTNLSIARALQRSKEIGLRKITGSTRQQIISQFLVETCVFSLFALFLGFAIYNYLLPLFPQMLPDFAGLITLEPNYGILIYFVLFSLFLGLLSGILPALYFSKTSPLTAIRQRSKHHPLSLINLRRVLSGIQVSLSMLSILVIFTINDYYRQMETSHLGFTTESLISFDLPYTQEDLISPVLEEIPEIKQFTRTSFIPGAGIGGIHGVETVAGTDSTFIRLGFADDHFDEVYQPEMLLGAGFSEEQASTDFVPVMVHKELLNKLNISLDSALGTYLTFTRSNPPGQKMEIVGVMDDYIVNALTNHLYPMVIKYDPTNFKQKVTLSFHEDVAEVGIDKLESAWAEVFPDYNLNMRFVDDLINDSYQEFKAIIQVITYLGMVIICISLLGQLGLALYKAETRTKEIGIRKTFGAATFSIILKLLKGTAITIGIAAAITVPLVYWVFGEGLSQSITTPTQVNLFPISMAILTLSAFTFVIIVSQTWRIANQNPTESLRYE